MREIKFRAWDKKAVMMRDDGQHPNGKPHMKYDVGIMSKDAKNEWASGIDGLEIRVDSDNFELMQYTGLKDKNGNEIYEGDIFRIEENGREVDDVDRIFYVVIVWVKEWAMFCSLLVDDEYFNYMNDGIKALDEPMFWSYTLEDTDSKKHFLCGNIYENPELIAVYQEQTQPPKTEAQEP